MTGGSAPPRTLAFPTSGWISKSPAPKTRFNSSMPFAIKDVFVEFSCPK